MECLLGELGCVQLDVLCMIFAGDPEVPRGVERITITIGSGSIVVVGMIPSTVVSRFILILCGLILIVIVDLTRPMPLVARGSVCLT